MRLQTLILLAAISIESCVAASGTPTRFAPGDKDIVAMVGGADMASASESGHLQTLLSVAFPGAQFRDFSWEGHTVFAQPRDVGFPSLREQLTRARATYLMVQFGRGEALDRHATEEFGAAYGRFLDGLPAGLTNVVLLTPTPFEKGGGLRPDLSTKNSRLASHASVIREIGSARGLLVLDVFSELSARGGLTQDGLQLTPAGHAIVAAAVLRQLGFDSLAQRAGEPNEHGVWPNRELENLRQLVIARNKLWFHYRRPQNWAFLGGDRTEQPSSRDHRDPSQRWFPVEMQQFVPLIEEKEREIAKQSIQLAGGAK